MQITGTLSHTLHTFSPVERYFQSLSDYLSLVHEFGVY